MYIYRNSGDGIFTVGSYDPGGRFLPESDHTEKSAAAGRIHYLNGGVGPELFLQVVQRMCDLLSNTNYLLMDLREGLSHDQN